MTNTQIEAQILRDQAERKMNLQIMGVFKTKHEIDQDLINRQREAFQAAFEAALSTPSVAGVEEGEA